MIKTSRLRKIEERKRTELIPYENNPRDNDKAVDAVAASIREFGFNVPIVIDKDDIIVAGHTRLKAAEKLGLETVPCIVVDDLNDDLVRQYRLVDNKVNELANWNYTLLIEELQAIDEIDMSAFKFGGFFDEAQSGEVKAPNQKGSLEEGVEIDLSEFEDEKFNRECPNCGFMWNE